QGNYEEVRALFLESLAISRRLSDKLLIVTCLEGLARVAGRAGQAERALRLFAAAAAVREAIGFPRRAVHPGLDPDRHIAALREVLDPSMFDTAWEEGRAMTLEEAIAYAMEEDAAPSV